MSKLLCRKNLLSKVKGTAAVALVGLAFGVQAADIVTLTVPTVEGATASVFSFGWTSGWLNLGYQEVYNMSSNVYMRVEWTADVGKALTVPGAKNVFRWREDILLTNAATVATAPTVTSGESEVAARIDTRADKKFYRAADIPQVWFGKGEGVSYRGADDKEPTLFVMKPSDTNTAAWLPPAQSVYTLSNIVTFATAKITYQLPVEVKTNGLEIAGTTYEVTANGEALPEDGIVGSNDTVKVVYTVADVDKYFVDGLTTYETTFSATQDVNVVSAMIEKPVAPKAPCVRLGEVAQRYPWNNMLDVTYQALYTPAKGYVVTIDVTADGAAGGASQTVDAKTGISTVSFDSGVIGTSFSEMNTKEAKVKVKIQKVQ